MGEKDFPKIINMWISSLGFFILNNLFLFIFSEISKLKLRLLDFSGNKISKIPAPYRKMDTLEDLVLDHNPLVSPPAHVSIATVHLRWIKQVDI